jgi:hypothetical protein
MAHSFTVAALNKLGNDAKKLGDPMSYLRNLGPIHLQWHRGSLAARRIGFLLFHYHVIENLKKCGGPAMFGGIKPYTPAQFAAFGQPYDVTSKATNGDLDSLADFSLDLEGWHGDAHMAIGMATGVDMMNPLTNINHVEFWRLHYFINAKFFQQLRRYDPAGSNAKRVAKIEALHHSKVGRV